jgi:hypothetical protein
MRHARALEKSSLGEVGAIRGRIKAMIGQYLASSLALIDTGDLPA